MDEEGRELVFYTDRKKIGWVVLGAVLLTGAGIWFAVQPEQFPRYPSEMTRVIGVVCTVLFGFCSVVGVWRFVRPGRLILNQEGFQSVNVRTSPLVRWRDVEAFFVSQIRSTKVVSYRLTPEARGLRSKINRTFVEGADGAVISFLKASPDEVAALLTQWHSAHSD